MPARIAAVAARAALGRRDEPASLVVAHLLHADAGGLGQIDRSQKCPNRHVKPVTPSGDFSGPAQAYSDLAICQPSILACMF